METESSDSLALAPSLASLSCVLGELTQADGSASLTQGNTSVLAAVYGPCEVKMSKEILDKATVEVICKPKAGLPKCADKFREQHIRQVFQTSLLVYLHPRSSITIVLQEREDDGGYLGSCINAACLALLDAGVSMKFLVAAVTAIIDTEGNIHFAPLEKQLSTSIAATLMFVFSHKDSSIIGVSSSGKFTQSQYDRCVSLSRQASQDIFKFHRESMERKLSKYV